MSRYKKAGLLFTSSILSLSMFSSIASASTMVNGQPEKVRIQVASTDIVVTKEELIKKFREMFPNQFDFLTNSDFHVRSPHMYPEDETIRHDLSFTKTINGNQIYGNVGFVGEELEIGYFSYQPHSVPDALFPPKVSKEEAKKIAVDFMKNFLDEKDYQLETNTFNYYPQQILTEPIRYSFTFARTENQVPIADQIVQVSVLGNGDVVGFNKMSQSSTSSTFDDITQIKDKNELLKEVKENLSVDLNYQINYDYQTSDRTVELVYRPAAKLQGIEATTGKWMTANGYTSEFPGKTKIEKISANQLPSKQDGITVEEAKKFAEQFLAIESDQIKLNIDSIQEMDNYNGVPVISVHYMYMHRNGGSGSSLEFNKNTGEIIRYHNMKDHLLFDLTEKAKKENHLSQQEALSQAVKFIKEWVPSYLNNYAMPVEEPYVDERLGSYHFTFPRIVNGILVNGDQIGVGISADGSLNSLNVDYQEIENWSSSDEVISEQEAKTILEEALSLKLTYMKHAKNVKENHYDLVYLPVFNEESHSYVNARTGEWNNLFTGKDSITVSHPWAEEELNYLINAKVLNLKGDKSFNPDAAISKGEALKVLINSITYFYRGGYFGQENMNQTFENIDTKHPLYQQIERAVELGIIKADNPNFDVDSPITREELSIWMIRVLGLEQAAKDSSIFTLGFDDADKVQSANAGYIAIANSLGLVKAEQNQFNPSREVTYAELAVSTIRLAHAIAESGRGLRY
ncbi:S-layer homology domain-containing protein [Sporosarcina sp. ACRSL]|uniref:S-layer homology domain-containing protein n=1 Tax=Sporosarcina sp. ACRSL TaxID=2918215 RepID=UPI001EF5ADA4|nr:S-layer homology domain-containing protein [Sporosarcina sp. ACRSL]MCG7345190.1 S-layer homology domain-containing protein [Sporosarcina sp. ACRSL]